jgi:hypothetical protein
MHISMAAADRSRTRMFADEDIIMDYTVDEVEPRQCPCLRAFDSWSALWDPVNSTAIRRKQRDIGFYQGSAPLVG